MHELVVTRLIDAAPAQVWSVMTGRMGEWWCPPPWRSVVERLDHAPGGSSVIVMHGPEGQRDRNDGFILAWDEGRRFAMTDAIAGDLEPAGPFMIGIWEIAAEGAGTRYTARARHWTELALQSHRELGFELGWGQAADQLKALCEIS